MILKTRDFGRLVRWILVLTLFQVGCETGPKQSSLGYRKRISCFGSKSAKNHVVYLHGMHGRQFSEQERENLVNLQKVAEVMNLRVAVPQSDRACRYQGRWQRCWGTEMRAEDALDTISTIKQAANACFGGRTSYGVIGFANGGYIANKIFEYCLSPQHAPNLKYLVSVGSAKSFSQELRTRGSLRHCRPITLVIGKYDHANYQKNPHNFTRFRQRGADASIIVFPGGHEVPYGPMVSALRKFVEP